jgi:hypothetical protein
MRARSHDRLIGPPTPTQFDKEEWKWSNTREANTRRSRPDRAQSYPRQ